MSAPMVRTSEIALRLGVSQSAVSQWRTRYPSFPKPLYADASGRGGVFNWDEVEEWHYRFRLRQLSAYTPIGTRLNPYTVTRTRKG